MEIYKNIVGYFGLYQISNFGNVKTLYLLKERILKPGLSTAGYLQVSLTKNKVKKTYSIHRLVANHFIDYQISKMEVNHKNGIKTDNKLENLEWATRSQNIQHMYDTGLKTYKPLHYKGKFGNDHNRSKSVKCIETSKIYGSMSEASRELKISISSISMSVKYGMPVFGMHFQTAI